MFGLNNISIDLLTGNPLLVWGLLVLLLGLTFLLYRKTNPPIPLFKRIILISLRIIAVVALVTALFEPIISYTHEFEREPRVALLLDKSLSMERTEDGKKRSERLDSILASNELDRINNNSDLKTYYFGEKLEDRSDNIQRDKTALGDILEELENKEIAQKSDYWILFSDGNSNTGRNPINSASKLSTPVISIGMAGDVGEFDISIADLDFNPILFVGQKAEINVKIKWHSASGKKALIQLKESGRVASEKHYEISEDVGFSDLKLNYLPTEPGQKLLEIAIQSLDGELSEANNSRNISVKVLKSRLAVLLASSQPDYEVGFLKRFLESSERYDVDLVLTGKSSGNLAANFPGRQTQLNRYDLIILYDPKPSDVDAKKELLSSFLKEKGGGIWMILGEQFATASYLPWMKELLPFYPTDDSRSNFRYHEFHATPAEGELFHPAIRLDDDRASIRQTWSDLPPFGSIVTCQTTAPSATILAYLSRGTTDNNRLPILGYRRHGPGKIIALSALPFWTWGFKTLGYQQPTDDYNRFVDGIANWLTIQDDFDPIRILPEKNIFSRGEAVRFDGFAFDQGFRPIQDLSGLIKLENKESGETYQTDLIGKGEGKYQAEFRQLPPGEYQYDASFEKDGTLLKNSHGNVMIESFSLEEFDQSGNPATLMAIADASGGKFYNWYEFEKAVSGMNLDRVKESLSEEFRLWGKLWLLIIFIAALALEWFIRKTSHLI